MAKGRVQQATAAKFRWRYRCLHRLLKSGARVEWKDDLRLTLRPPNYSPRRSNYRCGNNSATAARPVVRADYDRRFAGHWQRPDKRLQRDLTNPASPRWPDQWLDPRRERV